jgi:Fanconi anemia group M protein
MINDIFSKTPTTKNPKTPITIDHREKNSLVPAELYSQNFKIEFKQLPIGDYLINDTIIERKEINDFIQSIKSKRIFKQLEEIKQYPNYLLIIEGNIYTQKTLHPNSLRGAILSAATSYKIPIIFVQHPKETAQYISILAKKEKSKHPPIPTPIKTNFTNQSWQIHILESFPGIGTKTAEKLLQKFKTLKQIFNLSEETLHKHLKQHSKKIFRIINKRSTEQDTTFSD